MGAEKALQAVIKMRDETSKILRQVETATKSLNTQTNNTSESQVRLQDTMDKVGSIAKKAGGALITGIGAGLAASTKAGIEWESAFAGVKKTVDTTDAQLAKLSTSIRNMSKEMPTSAVEIAGVAEAAGQLGIEVPNIEGFTKNMVMLGDSTNMSAEEAATSLAKVANITGMSQKNFDKLGSTIVALGNNMATTEADIVAMSLRLAGSGKQANMTEHQIMGISAAMSSVGINAEAGGGSMSRIMQKINSDVMSGKGNLENFAKVSGVSSQEFQKAWRDDAASALTKFIEGLGHAKDAGKDVTGILKEMGITSIQEVDTMLRLSGAGELMAQSLGISSKAWKENTALINEANQRYETTESKIAILKNTIIDLGISMYEKFKEPFRDSLDTALESVKKLSSTLTSGGFSSSVESIASSFGTLLSAISKVVTTALPPLIKGLGWILKNGSTIATILISIKTAMMMIAAVKTVLGMVAAFQEAQLAVALFNMTAGLSITKLSIFEVIVGLVTGKLTLATVATKAWSAACAMLGGPIGIAIVAITALVAGFLVLWNTNKGFRDGVIGIWNSIKQAAVQTWGSICNFFTQTIPQAWENTKQAFANAGQWFGQVWNNIKQSFNNGISAITGFVESSKQNIVSKFKAICTGIQTAFFNGINAIQNFFTQTIPTIIDNVVNWFKDLPERLGEIIGFAIGRTILFGIAIGNFFTQTIPTVINNIINWFKELPGKIAEQFNIIVTNVTTWGVNFYTNATTTVSNTVNSIVNFFVALPGRIATFFNMVIQNVITWGTQFVTNARTGVTNAVNIIVTFMSQLPGKVKAKFNQVISAAVAWATSFAAKGKEGATKFATRLYDELKKIPGKVKKFGKDIVDGILNGIRNAINGAANAFASFGRGIVNGIKKGLDINSPSGLARDEIGVHIPTGIAVGVAKAIPTAIRMINKSMYKMMDGIDTPEKEMNIGVSTSSKSNTGVSSSNVSTENSSGSVSVSKGKGDVSFHFHIENMNVREESDVKKIAKELLKELKLSEAGGVVGAY